MRARPAKNTRHATLAVLAAAVAPVVALADVSANTSGSATQNGSGDNAVTISLSGSTAMRSFTTSPGITFLNPGSSITINDGLNGGAVVYTAPNVPNISFQLASGNFLSADQPVGGPFPSTNTTQVHSALRLEWHEQGSVEGILEMANDQIGYLNSAPLIDPATRNANAGNPIWVNRNKYTAAGNVNGLPIANSNYNTYSAATYDTSGRNLQGGMNRVQMAISDVKAVQGFAVGGNVANGNLTLTPGALGYGKGNSALGLAVANSLPTNGAAVAGAFYQLHDASVLNMSTDKVNPQTGTTYSTGAWNTAGTDNVQSTTVAVTASVFAANPGTGLDKINRTDAQWLQTSSRLANGASFNFTQRDVGSGTRNVAALNTGIDPTFAVGVNDDGNGNNLTAGNTFQEQLNVGPAMRFSNKTAGGGQLRPTVQNNRMAIGPLSISDAISSVSNGGGNKPLRALSYSDSVDGSSPYVTVGASSITDGSYAIWQQEQYVTVKNANAAFAGDTAAQWAARTDSQTGIKGDNAGGNVAAFRNNILVSTSLFPSTNSVANAGDQLLASGFVLPQMMAVAKPMDGVGLAVSNGTNYNAGLRTALLNSSYAANFNADAPTTITKGAGSTYGNAGNNTASFLGQINVTSQNYLFGNFNQNGTRDFAALQTAQQAQADLAASGAGTNIFNGSNNGTVVAFHGTAAGLNAMVNQQGGTGATKGDLVVLGDFNGDGSFDGKDLYAFATGAALSDSASTTTLTPTAGETLGDAIRRGVLRKNAAMDWLQTSATAQQKADAAVTTSANPRFTAAVAQANAFNRFDVNHDGVADLIDAAVVDKFVGKNPANLVDQVTAVITANATTPADITNLTKTQMPINLYTVKQIDGPGAVSHVLVNGDSDFHQVYAYLNRNAGGAGTGANAVLLDGDTNFTGKVDFADVGRLLSHYNQPGTSATWSQGDSTFDGKVNFADVGKMLANYNKSGAAPSASPAVTLTSKPEPEATAAAATATVELDVNTSTGDVKIVTSNGFSTYGYDIQSNGSAGNSLNGANWQRVNNGNAFGVFSNRTDGDVTEASNVAYTFPDGTTDLGLLYRPGFARDLSFQVLDGNFNAIPATLVYTPEPTSLAALAIGAGPLLGRRRRRRQA